MSDLRSIIFSASQVRAILDDSETKIQWIIKPQNHEDDRPMHPSRLTEEFEDSFPLWMPGDRLWVREGFGHVVIENSKGEQRTKTIYKADNEKYDGFGLVDGWESPIHMPRLLSRITIEIVNILVQRLNNISAEDAIAEGVHELPLQKDQPGAWWTGNVSGGANFHARDPISAYRKRWESIHGIGSWIYNPWVWKVAVKRV